MAATVGDPHGSDEHVSVSIPTGCRQPAVGSRPLVLRDSRLVLRNSPCNGQNGPAMVSGANDMPTTVEPAAFDAAVAAVEAALAAGARHADARLVDRRHESMTARDGD